MFDPGVSKTQHIFKQLIPLACLFLTVILDRSSVLDFLPVPPPLLSLSTVYYWSLYRPDWVSLVGLMGIGFLDDSLSGAYLGQNTILFLLVYAVVLKQMDYFMTASFMRTWSTFFIIMGLCGCIQWGISAFFYAEPIDIGLMLVQSLSTAFAFPLVYYVLNGIASYTYDWE